MTQDNKDTIIARRGRSIAGAEYLLTKAFMMTQDKLKEKIEEILNTLEGQSRTWLKKQLLALIDKHTMDAVRQIAQVATEAGITPHELTSTKDWKEALDRHTKEYVKGILPKGKKFKLGDTSLMDMFRDGYNQALKDIRQKIGESK